MKQSPLDNFVRLTCSFEHKSMLANFVRDLKIGGSSFRYYASRPLDVFKSHEVTFLLKDNENLVAYGHLEVENKILWLGIAVADNFKGRGYGSLMMEKLIEEASSRCFETITLRVDTNNTAGIGLYKKYGFEILTETGTRKSILMEKKIIGFNSYYE